MEFFEHLNPFDLFSKSNRDIIDDIIIYVYIVLFLQFLHYSFLKILDKLKPASEYKDIYNRSKTSKYITIIISIICIIPVFYNRVNSLPTILAFTGAGLILSLKDITLSIVGWFFIHGKSGFHVGDRIEVDHVKGEVVNVGLTKFTLLEVNPDWNVDQSTNRLIHIPNHIVILHKIFVISKEMDLIWDEIKLHLSFYSNWKKAESICSEIIQDKSILESYTELLEEKRKKLSENYFVRSGKSTPIVYTTIEDGKITLNLRYLTKIHQKRTNRTNISKEILIRMQNQNDIYFV